MMMDPEQFRIWGKRMVDLVADYWLTLPKREPTPDVKPGFMRSLVPEKAPEEAEDWHKIFGDIEPCILKKSTHWHHPHFFGYYPVAISYPAILGDILSGGLGCVGLNWISNPACTELELIMMDWLAKMMNLPEYFLNSNRGPGAGMIQSTASECTLIALLAARARALKDITNETEKYAKMGKLIAYTSDQAHSSVERAALLASIKMRLLPTDENFALQGAEFEKAVKEDLENGLEPIFLCASWGTTSSCAFDNLLELGPICQRYNILLHVDAAYAGAMLICPEYRHLMKGIEFADSFNVNAHKLLATSFDCAAFWMRDCADVKNALMVDPLYLRHAHEDDSMDLRHYQVPLGRRFRALKLWFTLRAFGVTGLQEHVRRGSNKATEKLLDRLNQDRRVFMVPTNLRDKFVLRLAINPASTTSQDLEQVWTIIQNMAKLQNGFLHNGFLQNGHPDNGHLPNGDSANGQAQNGHSKHGQLQSRKLPTGNLQTNKLQNGKWLNGHLLDDQMQNGHLEISQLQNGYSNSNPVNGQLQNGHAKDDRMQKSKLLNGTLQRGKHHFINGKRDPINDSILRMIINSEE